jgi:hypothetical protein
MSFWTVVEQDATEVENAVVAGAKTCLDYVDNVFVTEIEPALETALKAAIAKLGQAALAAIIAAL